MQRRVTLSLLVLGLLGCVSIPEPDWFQALRDREIDPRPEHRIASDDGFFQARVPARPAGGVDADGDAYRVSLEIGTTAPVDCWIYRDGVDFAASLSALSEQTFQAISRNLGEVQFRKVDRVDAGVMGESPFLALDWLYTLRADGATQVGLIKHLVTSKGGRGLYCQHNEVGYEESFRRVVVALRESLAYREALLPTPYYAAVSTMAVRGMRVGVEHTTVVRDGGQASRIDRRTSMLVPVTADVLQASDTFAVEFTRPDGSLINQVHVESSNGELVSHLKLDPQPGGAWTVEGTFQRKPLSARIEPGQRPSSWLGEVLSLRDRLATSPSGAAIRSTRWVPEADPTRLLEGTLTVEEPVGPEHFAAKLDAAGLEVDMVVDRQGTVASASVDMGAASLDFEQVYSGGRL